MTGRSASTRECVGRSPRSCRARFCRFVGSLVRPEVLSNSEEMLTTTAEQTVLAALLLAIGRGSLQHAQLLPSEGSNACGHVFRKNELVYRCKYACTQRAHQCSCAHAACRRTCGADDTCVLCAQCYAATDHEGHNVFFAVSTGNGTHAHFCSKLGASNSVWCCASRALHRML